MAHLQTFVAATAVAAALAIQPAFARVDVNVEFDNLPPFEQATQSLKMMNRGSLVLDLTGKGEVVWRGVAQTNIKFDADNEKRESLLREGVRDLLAKYPPRR